MHPLSLPLSLSLSVSASLSLSLFLSLSACLSLSLPCPERSPKSYVCAWAYARRVKGEEMAHTLT